MTQFDFLKDAADPSTVAEINAVRAQRTQVRPNTERGNPMLSVYSPPADKYLLVVDPETGETVGHLNYPSEFCPGLSCPYKNDSRFNNFSYFHLFTPEDNRRWAHVSCDRPTVTWWDRTVRDLVVPLPDKRFPWDDPNV